MACSHKKETEILADAMVSASVSLDDMAAALGKLTSSGFDMASAAGCLIAVLDAYADAPPQYICSKHDIIESDEVVCKGIKGIVRYCARCYEEDGRWTRVYKWSDQLTREDFEISPRSPKN